MPPTPVPAHARPGEWRVSAWDPATQRGFVACSSVEALEFGGADIGVVDPVVGERVAVKLKTENGRLGVVRVAPHYAHLGAEHLPLIAARSGGPAAVEALHAVIAAAAQGALDAIPPVHELGLAAFDDGVLRFEARGATGLLLGALELSFPQFALLQPRLHACWVRLCTEHERRYLGTLCDLGDTDVALAFADPAIETSTEARVHFAVGCDVIWRGG